MGPVDHEDHQMPPRGHHLKNLALIAAGVFAGAMVSSAVSKKVVSSSSLELAEGVGVAGLDYVGGDEVHIENVWSWVECSSVCCNMKVVWPQPYRPSAWVWTQKMCSCKAVEYAQPYPANYDVFSGVCKR